MVVVALAPTASADEPLAACEVSELPLPESAIFSGVTAGDPSGRWLGGYLSDDADFYRTLLWHRGELVDFDAPLVFASIDGINRRGVAVGTGSDDEGATISFAYVAGEAFVTLAPPEGAAYARPQGVSNGGTVVGYGFTPGSFPQATVWSLEQPDEPFSPRLPASTEWSEAVDVSPRGTVAVKATMTDGQVRSFVYAPNGKRTELKPLEAGADLSVIAVANGWATAYEVDLDGENYAVRYELGTGAAERVPLAGTVNGDGVVGGRDYESDDTNAALYTDSLLPLPGLDDVDGGGQVTTIDRAGNAAGVAGNPDGFESAAVRWHCD
jgi:hypothetical protein